MIYTVRFAQKKDTSKIMLFIDTYWRKEHILSRDRNLFEWQYGGEGDKLNIVIGIDDDGEIQGMLGFIPYDVTNDKDIALALWKANPSTGFLGIRLIRYLIDNEPHRKIVCPGINIKTTSKIYEYVDMKVSTMTQWYRLAKRDSYKIAKVEDPTILVKNEIDDNIIFAPVENDSILKECCKTLLDKKMVPYKSESYLLWRYFNHPKYKYKVYATQNSNGEKKALFVFRIQECNGSKALRMIDCIGDFEEIKRVTLIIDQLMDGFECEYVDTYEAGISDSIFLEGGWRKVLESGNIIPDYFAPFEHRKVDIHYSTSDMRATLFKGDGDQDRPN